jgi:hypothetical protein
MPCRRSLVSSSRKTVDLFGLFVLACIIVAIVGRTKKGVRRIGKPRSRNAQNYVHELDNDLLPLSEYVADAERYRDPHGIDWWVYRDRTGRWWTKGGTRRNPDANIAGPFPNSTIAKASLDGHIFGLGADGTYSIPVS